MKSTHVDVVAKTPFIMHADHVDWSDRMDEWKADPRNKALSKPGDDRTPPWRWFGCLNYDHPKTGVITIPSEYIMRCIMGGAAEVQTGKGQKTFKSLSQSGLLCSELHWPLLVDGKPIKMADISELLPQPGISDKSFNEHRKAAEALGFSLYVRRVKVGMTKHIRVRPMFDRWSTAGEIVIADEQQITTATLATILDIAGRFKGLGDWRPGAKTPGVYGMFSAKVS